MTTKFSRCLVTGGAGFIGSNFVRLACAEKWFDEIAVVDNLSYGGSLENLNGLGDRVQFNRVDIRDFDQLSSVFEAFKPDVVFHLAAQTHVDRSILTPEPFVTVNVLGTMNILECCKRFSVPRLIHVSTDEVYGSADGGTSFSEVDPLNPSSPYSASKAGSDLLVLSYVKTFGLPAVITRSSNNYGPYQLPEKFIPVVITNLLEGDDVPIYGTGENIRNWIFVEDNCRGLYCAGTNGRVGEIYNIGGLKSAEISNLELAKMICDLLGCNYARLKFVKDRPGHDFRYSLTCEKAQRELDWSPKVELLDGLKKTVNWYRENREWWKKRRAELKDYYQQNYANR